MMLDVALECARRGWYVFPCAPRSKRPATAHGWKDGTLDEAQIRAWWTKTPDANVAIATGPSNLAVFDVDHGLSTPADAGLFMARNGVPDSYAVRTGRRDGYGLQVYFQGARKSAGGWELDGCSGDVKSAGGYVMAAGSIHPDSGEAYEVVHAAPVAPVPEVVRNLRAKTEDREVLTGDGPITEFRNETMVRILGRMRNAGLSDAGIEREAEEVNATRMVPPLGEDELARIVANVCRYSAGQPEPEVLIGGKAATADAIEPEAPKDWRARYTTFEQFRDVQPPSFLIQDFLEDGAIMALGAPVAQRKSIVVANIIRSLLTGESLFDHFEVRKRPTRVIYLCPEMGLVDVANRFKRLGLAEYVGSGLFIRTMEDARISLTELSDELPGSVLILDTLTRFVSGNQNDAGDMSKFADMTYEVRRKGATVILLHHSVKGSGDKSMSLDSALRGSTELAAFVTCVWSTQLQDPDKPHTAHSNLKCVKQRGFPSEPFQVSCDEDFRMRMLGSMGAVKSQKQATSEAALAEILKDSPDIGINKLQEALRVAGHRRGGKWITSARLAILGSGVTLNGNTSHSNSPRRPFPEAIPL